MYNINDSIYFELIESKRVLNFYLSEIENYENNLAGINRWSQNSAFSYRAEIMLSQLSVQTTNFLNLKNKVTKEEDFLAQNSNSGQGECANNLKTIRQEILRDDIYKSEKDFLKVKYCYNKFLANHQDGGRKMPASN